MDFKCDELILGKTDADSRALTLIQLHPAEAQRLMEIAQKVVEQKWTTYEGMALYSAEAFHPDARK